MNRVELLACLDFLGLSREAAAGAFGLSSPASVRAWLSGRTPVPPRVGSEVAEMLADADRRVIALTAELNASLDPVAVVWTSDEAMWAARPELHPWPARWWRQIAVRAIRAASVDAQIVSDRTTEGHGA